MAGGKKKKSASKPGGKGKDGKKGKGKKAKSAKSGPPIPPEQASSLLTFLRWVANAFITMFSVRVTFTCQHGGA